ncbi:DNA/RNA helicase domain-containing protein [Flavobacterium polysaccharolyticum]|uniref:DNA/RNA helicase domain-containing protein n=1 Tax=Flavobacterium polysaccharolyticum TaxID=3133148 RepID=A0ABU9NQC9_9FLAO
MKEINLISLLDAYRKLDTEIFNTYLNYYSISIKKSELDDLSKLVNEIKQLNQKANIFENYFIGYIIPQISKEFDLLRIDNDTVLNIEIKQKSTIDKIQKQLERNMYYLSFLKKEIHCFTYISEENKLYTIDNNNQITKSSFRQLLSIIASQNIEKINEINSLFNPSNYLVSPFNSTNEFIKGRYFLTTHQENIKKEILEKIYSQPTSILSIKGKAGTGKTLLIYDIAKEIYKRHEVLLIHCGHLNEGHKTLIQDFNWNIISAKYLFEQDYSKYKLVILDEVQRVYPNFFDRVIKEVKKNNSNCILSHDEQQTLHKREIDNKIPTKLEAEITHPTFELTNKIRTNKEVANFIECLFNKDKQFTKQLNTSIELTFFENLDETIEFISYLKTKNWKIINYTPDGYKTFPYERFKIMDELNSHTVIGQEFDNVVAIIDEHFYYKINQLSTRGYKKNPYYHPTKMLYQIISRTRLKLHLIVFRNQDVLSRCLSMLK